MLGEISGPLSEDLPAVFKFGRLGLRAVSP